MADSLTFELVSPEQLLISREVSSVTMPGAEGEFTILPDHAPFMASLKPGIVRMEADGKEEQFVIFGGFADVQNNRCTLLAEQASRPEEIDQNHIDERIARARRHLEHAETDEERRKQVDYLNQLTQLNENIVIPA